MTRYELFTIPFLLCNLQTDNNNDDRRCGQQTMKGLLKGVRSRLKNYRRSSLGAQQGPEENRDRDLPRSVSPNDETAAVANSTPSPRTMDSVPSDRTSQEGILVPCRSFSKRGLVSEVEEIQPLSERTHPTSTVQTLRLEPDADDQSGEALLRALMRAAQSAAHDSRQSPTPQEDVGSSCLVTSSAHGVNVCDGVLDSLFIFAHLTVLSWQEGDTPLHDAVRQGNYEIAKALLDLGADPNSKGGRQVRDSVYSPQRSCRCAMV